MAVICIFKLQNNKYFVLRMDGDNLKKVNNFVFENETHELNEFLSKDVLESDWIKKNPIISLDLIEYSPNESDTDLYTIKLMRKYGINNVRGGNYCNVNLENDTINHIEKLLI